jgi:uncharacterized protein YjbI with pentapeptide repeats
MANAAISSTGSCIHGANLSRANLEFAKLQNANGPRRRRLTGAGLATALFN